MNIGLIGVGTIGSGVIHLWKNNFVKISSHTQAPFKLTTVCDLDFSKCTEDLSEFTKTTNYRDLLQDKSIGIIIELIGGEEPARTIIESALQAGKNVVTANKLVMAKHGDKLQKLAQEQGVALLYEAAVGGAIPIINSLKNALAPNNFEEIVGILNGTTNFILTKMQLEDADYSEVLKEAQALGYAEADPSSDVLGMDSQYKLAILAAIAYQTKVDLQNILVEGITKISAKDIEYIKGMDSCVKLLALARQRAEGIELRVSPVILKNDHPLASVNGVFNAVFVVGDAVGETMFYGRGAGSVPTAGSVWADIINIVNNTPYRPEIFKPITFLKSDQMVSKFYFRFRVSDQVGVLRDLSAVFAANNISIKTALQRGFDEDAELVIITHEICEADKNKAINQIQKLSCVREICNIIRVGV